MYTSKNFDFKSIIEKSKKIDTKINFNSNYVKCLKKNIISTLNIGFVIACIFGIIKVSSKMNFLSYFTLKKLSKKEYEI